MKTLLLSSHVVAGALALMASLHAQSSATPPALGLLRLKSAAKPNDAAPLVTGKFSVDELSASGVAGASKGKRDNVDYVALDSGKEWTRPLRGNPHDVTFVSFQVYASQTTIIDVAGARLGFTASPVSGSLQVMFDDSTTGAPQWKSLNYHVATGKYDGKNFAALPTMTVRLDPEAGTWDVFSGSRMIADNLPLIDAKKNDRTFDVRAGTEGVWITGLVLADENPLYEDANNNGIDDNFERSQRGGLLLAADVSKTDKQYLSQQWKNAQRTKSPPALLVNRPLPDDAAVSLSPKS